MCSIIKHQNIELFCRVISLTLKSSTSKHQIHQDYGCQSHLIRFRLVHPAQVTSCCENVPGQCVALTFGNGRTKVELEVGWTCCLSGRIDTYSLSSALYKEHILHHISESTQIYATRRFKNEDKREIDCSKWHFYTFMILLQYFFVCKIFFWNDWK